MPALLDLLYREYCRARLAEMRKQRLPADNGEVPDANCDGNHAGDCAGDPGRTRQSTSPNCEGSGQDKVLRKCPTAISAISRGSVTPDVPT